MKKGVSEHGLQDGGGSYGNGGVNIAVGVLRDAESADFQQTDESIEFVEAAGSVA